MDVGAADGALDTALLHYEVEADVLALPAEVAAVETALTSGDEAALEAGIASVFDELLNSDATYLAPEPEAGYIELVPDEPEPTVLLLEELNRLWAQPLAA
jgi:hypothetical protein